MPRPIYEMTPYTARPMKNIAVMTGRIMAKRVSRTKKLLGRSV
jgi:hypothetical protein